MKLFAVILSFLLFLSLVECQQLQQNPQLIMRRRSGRRQQQPLMMRAGGFSGPPNAVGPVGPPRQQMALPAVPNDGMPGLRPPKGIAEQLNRAKLKDFMQLGQVLMQRRRLHA